MISNQILNLSYEDIAIMESSQCCLTTYCFQRIDWKKGEI